MPRRALALGFATEPAPAQESVLVLVLALGLELAQELALGLGLALAPGLALALDWVLEGVLEPALALGLVSELQGEKSSATGLPCQDRSAFQKSPPQDAFPTAVPVGVPWPSRRLRGSPMASTRPSLLTLWLCLGEFRMLQLGQEKVGTALQVGAGHVELHIGHQLLEAGKVGGLTEVLRVLVQPGAQDGGDGTGAGGRVGRRVRGPAFASRGPSLAPPWRLLGPPAHQEAGPTPAHPPQGC